MSTHYYFYDRQIRLFLSHSVSNRKQQQQTHNSTHKSKVLWHRNSGAREEKVNYQMRTTATITETCINTE